MLKRCHGSRVWPIRIVLDGQAKRVIDSVNFEVRGMPLLPTDKSDDADKDEINDNSHLSTPWEKPPPE